MSISLSSRSVLLLAGEWRGTLYSLRNFAIMNGIDWDLIVLDKDSSSSSVKAYAESLVNSLNDEQFLAYLDEVFSKENFVIAEVNKELAKDGLAVKLNGNRWELVEISKSKESLPGMRLATGGASMVGKKVQKEMKKSNVEPKKPTLNNSNNVIELIALIKKGLRKQIRKSPASETEIHDSIENLIIGTKFETMYSREKISIPYSSKYYFPDFVFEDIDTTLEAKFCNSKEDEKKIIAEINDDILAYKTRFVNLIFLVYDLGHIRDADQFKKPFETNDCVTILVIKH